MKDFAQDNALYFDFGSLVANPDHGAGIDNYMKDVATLILSEYGQNKAIKAQTRLRKDFNVDSIFKRMLEPAILEIANEK